MENDDNKKEAKEKRIIKKGSRRSSRASTSTSRQNSLHQQVPDKEELVAHKDIHVKKTVEIKEELNTSDDVAAVKPNTSVNSKSAVEDESQRKHLKRVC